MTEYTEIKYLDNNTYNELLYGCYSKGNYKLKLGSKVYYYTDGLNTHYTDKILGKTITFYVDENGRYHRTNGPAIESPDDRGFYNHGEPIFKNSMTLAMVEQLNAYCLFSAKELVLLKKHPTKSLNDLTKL